MKEGLVRLITVQFSFSNRKIIPNLIRFERETKIESITRKARASGVLQIEPTERISIAEFPQDLTNAWYTMVDAFYQLRSGVSGKAYHIVRFTFVRNNYVADVAEEFIPIRGSMHAALQEICDSAFWRVQAFKNPFFENDTPIDGQYAVSVNLEARVPFVEPSGEPVVQWKKDMDGNRLGDKPIPIEPKGWLRLEAGQIRLLVPTEVEA